MSPHSEPFVLLGASAPSAEASIYGDSAVEFVDPSSPQTSDSSPADSDPGHLHHGQPSLINDPPVIVGMACRLPGDIESPSDLWDFIVQQKSASGSVPPERYNIDGFYHPDGGNRSGLTDVPGGYFINDDLRKFDNGFFGMNNVEATYLDPQQRKLLEISYECLQSAGVPMSSLAGSTTGVFVANFSVDYQPMMTRDPDYVHRYVTAGSGATNMSNRISHVFDLHGPSFTIDTACSSSVYALHQALNAMETKDCNSVIVASANMVLSPEMHVAAAKSGVLSPTATCHTFDASADGYGRAEGVSAIYIKRLSAALRDGNPIRAVIRGTATNASGRTNGISLPSGEQQEKVMRKAYQRAGLDFAGTDYVECHGTGTPVGDPIEVNAVGKTFQPQDRQNPLLIGSVKTNVGHSEGSSGLTSIIKVVKSFESGFIGPSRGVTRLNPKLKLKEYNMQIATQIQQWPRALRRASINSFGYGGANAHVILESTDSYLSHNNLSQQGISRLLNGSLSSSNGEEEEQQQQQPQQLLVLPVSAASKTSLEGGLKRISEAVSKLKDTESTQKWLQRLAHTLSNGRDLLTHRGFLLARQDARGTGAELVKVDEAAAKPGKASANVLPFGFVFTGQGAQYAGMGKELLLKNPLFRSTIRELDDVLKALPAPYAPDWTLEQTLLDEPDTSRINEVTRSQPICTAVQIGLLRMLQSWGVSPTSVVGHSSGEIAAAHAAGLLSSSQAILVAYYRGYVVGYELRGKGAMMAAGMDAASAQSLIESNGLEGNVRVACVNSPESVTLSGAAEGIEVLKAELEGERKFARKLETGGRAYHSHMMEEVGASYEELLKPLFSGEAKAPKQSGEAASMYSSVGHDPEKISILGKATNMPAYWRQNLEQPVQFSQALTNLVEVAGGNIHLVELGPHSALKGPIQQVLGSKKDRVPYSSTLVRKQDAEVCLKTLAGTLYKHGYALDWSSINEVPSVSSLKSKSLLLPDVPAYSWDYSGGILWSEPRASVEMRKRKNPRHELLGTLALTGNGLDYTWRNRLRPSEIPWIKDHKLEDRVLFPAAGYVAMAIEAISQVEGVSSNDKVNKVAFELRNVNISAALPVPDESDPASKDLEVHTTMFKRKTSSTQASVDWYDFSISSWAGAEATTVHCTGSIRLTKAKKIARGHAEEVKEGLMLEHTDSFEKGPATRWYKQWYDEGMCFGPSFQSITSFTTDSERARHEAMATVSLQPLNDDLSLRYPVHPITIDSCIQAAIWSDAAGHVPSLRAWLPTYISECRIQAATFVALPVEQQDENSGNVSKQQEEGEIHTRSEETGVRSRIMEGTLRDTTGAAMVDLKGARISLFVGSKHAVHQQASSPSDADHKLEQYEQRQPALRVKWKPDVLRLSQESEPSLRAYVAEFVGQQCPDMQDDESQAVIAALVDLAGHKNPRMRVLELGGDGFGYKSKEWMGVLDGETAFSRYRSWHKGDMSESGELSVEEEGGEGPFDVLLIPRHATSRRIWSQAPPEKFASLVSDHGIVVTRNSDAAKDVWEGAGFHVLDVGKQVLLAVRPAKTTSLQGRKALIVQPKQRSPAVATFAKTLTTYLQSQTPLSDIKIIDLDQLGTTTGSVSASASGNVIVPDKDTVCISLLELEKEFLATMSPSDMNALRAMTDVVTDLLWLTGADMLGDNPDPNLTLANGLSRALMLEQPALRHAVLDVGPVHAKLAGAGDGGEAKALASTFANVVRAVVPRYNADDCEFIETHNSLLQVSRYVPDFPVNALFRRRLGLDSDEKSKSFKEPLDSVGPAHLAIGRAGSAETLHFKQLSDPKQAAEDAPSPDEVDIEVRAVSLTTRDVHAMIGGADPRDKTTWTALDFGGIVTAVGDKVTHLKVGDRAVVCAPSHFGTVARVRAASVHALKDGESFSVVPTVLSAYTTALYAIHDRARVRAGETVFVCASSGAVGIAAITLALKAGATVYTSIEELSVESQAERVQYLTEELGVPSSHILSSADASFVQGIRDATSGRGVDVIINNAFAGDLMHESWRCLSDFGRFIELGKRELLDAGRLDMGVFLRNATFSAVNMSEFFSAPDSFHRGVWDSLVGEALARYRAGEIQPPPAAKVFDITQVAEAYTAAKDPFSNVVVSLENPKARVIVTPSKYLSVFDPEKIYLLIGCLGGLGRSLSRWMVSRGARHFVFLGRSGADKPDAKQLVTRLEKTGATVHVVRGTVSSAADVDAAVLKCRSTGRSIGGVVQAAMGLHEALFTRMPNEAWHTGIEPKWKGTWNLHNSVEKSQAEPLDFFLLTSSVSGTVGTATESNYCSANGFLDSFARWRRSRGQACVAIGLGMISEVGYLHENPEIEALLLRKGIQPLNEEEMLQMVDLALISEAAHSTDEAHMLTGLEPGSIRELSAKGFDVSSHGVLVESRASVLRASLLAEKEAKETSAQANQGTAGDSTLAKAAAWYGSVPVALSAAFAPEADAETMEAAVLRLMKKRFSNLILMPVDQIDEDKPLPSFGIDSMISSEFRTWFFAVFGVDIPFLDLMSAQKSLGILADVVKTKVLEAAK